MNKLKFTAKVLDLYSEDYEYLQDSTGNEISKVFRQMVSNPGVPAIIRGFNLIVSPTNPTTLELAAENGYSSAISSTGILIEVGSDINNISLSDATLGVVNNVYLRIYSKVGSYHRQSKTILDGQQRAIDLSDYTLHYDREVDAYEILVYSSSEISGLSSSYLNSLIYLGKTTATGAGNPLTSVDLSNRTFVKTNIQPESILTNMISPTGFMLPQRQVGTSSVINDSFSGSKINAEDDVNEIRTFIKDMKGTEHYDDPSPTTLFDFDKSINAVHENGVFRYSGNSLNVVPTSTGLAVDILDGNANVGGAISRVLSGRRETISLLRPSAQTVGDWQIRDGQRRRFLNSPVGGYKFYLYNDEPATSTGGVVFIPGDGYPRYVDSSLVRITNSVNGPLGDDRFIQGGSTPDYTLDSSTGLVTVISQRMKDTWDGLNSGLGGLSETTDKIFKCYYTWGNPRYDAITIGQNNTLPVFRGAQAVEPEIPTTSTGVVNLAYVFVRPFATEIFNHDITDTRFYIDPVRELIDVTATTYNLTPRSVERINYYTSSGEIDEEFSQWALNTTEDGISVGAQTSTGGAYLETTIFSKELDELWLIVDKTPWINNIKIEYSDANSDILSHTLDVDLFFNTFLYKYPVFICKTFQEGYIKIRITVEDTSEYFCLYNIIVGKLDLYYNIHSLSDIDYIVPQKLTALRGAYAPIYRDEDNPRKGRLLLDITNKSICGAVGRRLNRWDIEQKYPVSRLGGYRITTAASVSLLPALAEVGAGGAVTYFSPNSSIISSNNHQRIAVNVSSIGTLNTGNGYMHVLIHNSSHQVVGELITRQINGFMSVGWNYFELPVVLQYGLTYHYHVYYTGDYSSVPTIYCSAAGSTSDKELAYLQFYKPQAGLYKSSDVINIINSGGASIVLERGELDDSSGVRHDLNQLDIMAVDFSDDGVWDSWEYDYASGSVSTSTGIYIGIDVNNGRIKFPYGYDAGDYFVEFNTKELGTRIDGKSVIHHGTTQTVSDFLNEHAPLIKVLKSDVTNNDGTPNTLANIDDLSFSVTSSGTYYFRAMVGYSAATTTTGSRWTINGPSASLLIYRSSYSLGATTQTINEGLTSYDAPATCNADSASTAGNIAIIEGILTASSDGTVVVRFASEVSGSAITAKKGSILFYKKVD